VTPDPNRASGSIAIRRSPGEGVDAADDSTISCFGAVVSFREICSKTRFSRRSKLGDPLVGNEGRVGTFGRNVGEGDLAHALLRDTVSGPRNVRRGIGVFPSRAASGYGDGLGCY